MKVLLGGLFAVFALLAGLFTAAAVALTGVLLVAIRRALGRGGVGPLPMRQRSRVPATKGDVIEITATEVPATESVPSGQAMPFTVHSPR